MRRSPAEIALSAGVLALGIGVPIGTALLPSEGGYARIGPNFVPGVVGGGLIVVGVWLLYEALAGGWREHAGRLTRSARRARVPRAGVPVGDRWALRPHDPHRHRRLRDRRRGAAGVRRARLRQPALRPRPRGRLRARARRVPLLRQVPQRRTCPAAGSRRCSASRGPDRWTRSLRSPPASASRSRRSTCSGASSASRWARSSACCPASGRRSPSRCCCRSRSSSTRPAR